LLKDKQNGSIKLEGDQVKTSENFSKENSLSQIKAEAQKIV
jgi:hypothetical protein